MKKANMEAATFCTGMRMPVTCPPSFHHPSLQSRAQIGNGPQVMQMEVKEGVASAANKGHHINMNTMHTSSGMVTQNGGMMMMANMSSMKGFVVPTNLRVMPPNSDNIHTNDGLKKKVSKHA
jgi:hypothetical protein